MFRDSHNENENYIFLQQMSKTSTFHLRKENVSYSDLHPKARVHCHLWNTPTYLQSNYLQSSQDSTPSQQSIRSNSRASSPVIARCQQMLQVYFLHLHEPVIKGKNSFAEAGKMRGTRYWSGSAWSSCMFQTLWCSFKHTHTYQK